MNHLLDSFLSLWSYWMFVSFGLGIIGFGLLFYVQYGKPEDKRKSLIIGGLLFAQVFATWAIAFGLSSVLENNVRNELLEFLISPNIQVKMNDELLPYEQSELVLNELKKVESIMAHHSHPTDRLTIDLIRNDETFPLRIERDSGIPTEYWVFSDKYKVTSSNEIGRLQTEIFD